MIIHTESWYYGNEVTSEICVCYVYCDAVDSLLGFFFFQAEDGIRDYKVTGVQTCALPIFADRSSRGAHPPASHRRLPGPAPRARRARVCNERAAAAPACSSVPRGARPDRKSVV